MVTRITGLASGMDIDLMVKRLMTAESKPLNKMNAQKQLMEWKRESYREASTKLVSFLQDKLAKLSMSSSINAQKVSVTGNTSAVSAVASSSASGVMDITVENLATASRAISGTGWSEKAATAAVFTDGLAHSVQIGGATIVVDANESIENFVMKINNNQQAGVTAMYDAKSGISFTSKATGAATINLNAAVVPDAVINLSEEIPIDAQVAAAFGLNASSTTLGEDAHLTVNGLAITKSSNIFEMNGVAITLKSKTPVGESSHLEVSKDTDKLVENVQTFVDAYNDVLATLNSKLNEEKFSKYAPLTTEERADMSDEEAKLWTTKAKSGMLKNDSILQNTLSDMRSAMLQGVDIGRVVDGVNKPLMLTELGISTGTYETRGKLILDADKLRTALDSNPDILTNFFGKKDPATLLSNEYTAQDGVFAKLRKISNVSLQKMAETAGTSKVSTDLTSSFLNTSTMGEQLTSLDRRIAEMVSRLSRIETNYFKRFSAMETAINKYNSTSSALSSMLS